MFDIDLVRRIIHLIYLSTAKKMLGCKLITSVSARSKAIGMTLRIKE